MIDWLARQIWWGMLWLIRRPLSRRLQRASLKLAPESKREKFRQSMIAQERFARRIGLPVLRFVLRVFFLSAFLTLAISYVLDEIEAGRLIIPTQQALDTQREQAR